jgi:hypothetical protein
VRDQPQRGELAEPLVDLDQLGAGSDRHHDLIGQPPAELLGDLEAEGLGTLRVVRADVHVHERPVLVLACQLGRKPVHIIVVPVDRDERPAVHGGRQYLLQLQVRRNHHDRTDPGAARRGRHGVREVARRGTSQDGEAHLQRRGQRDGHHPVLERVGRVAPVVLDPQVAHPELTGQAVGAPQLRVAGLGGLPAGDIGGYREQRGVAPDVARASLDVRPGQGGEVVADLKRAEALATGVKGTEIATVAAFAA